MMRTQNLSSMKLTGVKIKKKLNLVSKGLVLGIAATALALPIAAPKAQAYTSGCSNVHQHGYYLGAQLYTDTDYAQAKFVLAPKFYGFAKLTPWWQDDFKYGSGYC